MEMSRVTRHMAQVAQFRHDVVGLERLPGLLMIASSVLMTWACTSRSARSGEHDDRPRCVQADDVGSVGSIASPLRQTAPAPPPPSRSRMASSMATLSLVAHDDHTSRLLPAASLVRGGR